MTGLRFHSSSNPMEMGSPIHPMRKVDEDFWRLRRERKEGAAVKPSFLTRLVGRG